MNGSCKKYKKFILEIHNEKNMASFRFDNEADPKLKFERYKIEDKILITVVYSAFIVPPHLNYLHLCSLLLKLSQEIKIYFILSRNIPKFRQTIHSNSMI